MSLYIEGDTMKDVSFKKNYVSTPAGYTVRCSIPLFSKYWEEGVSAVGNCDLNNYLLRYDDALLMYALIYKIFI